MAQKPDQLHCIDFSDFDLETIAMCSEELMEEYLETIEALKMEIAGMEAAIKMIGKTTGIEEFSNFFEKRIPKKPYLDNDNGIYQKEHCPTCHRSLFPNAQHCRCGQVLDWSETK